MENQQEESKNELLKQFHAHQQEISSLKERISLLEFETQNISSKINPNKSKILQLVERVRYLYDEQKKQLQEIEKQIQRQKEIDLMNKQTKKKILKQSINDAVKFAQEHLKEEKKTQAQELKHIHKYTQNIIEKNKNVQLSEKQHRIKTIKDQESKSLQNVRHFFHDKKEKLANALSLEKMKIKNEVEKQSSELQNLEQLEMRYLMRLKQSRLQEQAFKNQMKDAYEMRVEDYAKKYKKSQK